MISKKVILLIQQSKRLFKILQNIIKNNGLLKSSLRNKMPFAHFILKKLREPKKFFQKNH